MPRPPGRFDQGRFDGPPPPGRYVDRERDYQRRDGWERRQTDVVDPIQETILEALPALVRQCPDVWRAILLALALAHRHSGTEISTHTTAEARLRGTQYHHRPPSDSLPWADPPRGAEKDFGMDGRTTDRRLPADFPLAEHTSEMRTKGCRPRSMVPGLDLAHSASIEECLETMQPLHETPIPFPCGRAARPRASTTTGRTCIGVPLLDQRARPPR